MMQEMIAEWIKDEFLRVFFFAERSHSIWLRNSSRPFLVSIWLVSHYHLHQHCSLVLGNDNRHLFEIKATKRGKMHGFESLRVKYVGPVRKFIDAGRPVSVCG
jgi:hypothetical protein